MTRRRVGHSGMSSIGTMPQVTARLRERESQVESDGSATLTRIGRTTSVAKRPRASCSVMTTGPDGVKMGSLRKSFLLL